MSHLKYIFTIICFLFISQKSTVAQSNFQAIESEKIAYISKELKLTPNEAARFFPVYNLYNKEMWELKKAKRGFYKENKNSNALQSNRRDVIAFDSKEVEIKKSYRSEFTKIIGQSRASEFFQVEEDFFNKLRSRLQNRRK